VKRAVQAALAAVALAFIFLLAAKDDPPVQDADIRPASALVPDAENGWGDFVRMRDALDATAEDRDFLGKQLDGVTDAPRVAKLIARNTAALSAFADLSRRKTFQEPAARDPASFGPQTPVTQFYPAVTAARLSLLRGDLLLAAGRTPEALDETLRVRDAGRLLADSRQPLIDTLVGMLLLDMSSARALALVKSGKLDKPRLMEAARRFAAPTGAARGVQDGLRFEYLMYAYTVDHAAEMSPMVRGPSRRLFFMPERTKAVLAKRWRSTIDGAGLPCAAGLAPDVYAPPRALRNYLGYNLLGAISNFWPQYSKLYVRRCATDYRAARAGIAAALAEYKRELGRYPTSLGVLAPRYVDAVPSDPYTGGPLAYTPETGEIRTDGKDPDGAPL
jgi:hypothetical protein